MSLLIFSSSRLAALVSIRARPALSMAFLRKSVTSSSGVLVVPASFFATM